MLKADETRSLKHLNVHNHSNRLIKNIFLRKKWPSLNESVYVLCRYMYISKASPCIYLIFGFNWRIKHYTLFNFTFGEGSFNASIPIIISLTIETQWRANTGSSILLTSHIRGLIASTEEWQGQQNPPPNECNVGMRYIYIYI